MKKLQNFLIGAKGKDENGYDLAISVILHICKVSKIIRMQYISCSFVLFYSQIIDDD